MKKILLSLTLAFTLIGCARYPGVPETYHAQLDSALNKTPERSESFRKLIHNLPETHREGAAFLISYMPQRDLDSLNLDWLTENIKLAYQARKQFPWGKEIPDSVFFNDVLPYVALNEERDAWRAGLLTRFTPHVNGCTSLKDAIYALNKAAHTELKAEYNTKREKPDQNPSETLRQAMASCSGLSIILVDAFRSVGIPARIAGAASWHDNRGNHNWVEVWMNGRWYFTEYYFDDLDKSWFIPDAGRAIPADRNYAIWASSFKPTGATFPLVWDLSIDYVHAADVSQRYIDLYQEYLKKITQAGQHVTLEVVCFKDAKNSGKSEDRIAINVDIFDGKEQLGGGRTAAPTQDMNDGLKIVVPKNRTITLKYADPNGNGQSKEIIVEESDVKVII